MAKKETPKSVIKAVTVEMYEDGNINVALHGEFSSRAEAVGLVSMAAVALSPVTPPATPKGGRK